MKEMLKSKGIIAFSLVFLSIICLGSFNEQKNIVDTNNDIIQIRK